ncbi:MAG: hypothetical protein ABI333_21170 [bacterium]
MALDEPNDKDEIQKVDGFSVFAEKQLLEQVGGVTVDYTVTGFGEGFSIKSGNQSPTECGSCSC